HRRPDYPPGDPGCAQGTWVRQGRWIGIARVNAPALQQSGVAMLTSRCSMPTRPGYLLYRSAIRYSPCEGNPTFGLFSPLRTLLMCKSVMTFLAVGLMLTGNSGAGAGQAPQDDTAAREVVKLVQTLSQAFVKGDAATIRRLLADDQIAIFGYGRPETKA